MQRGANALTVAEVSTKSGRTWDPRITQHKVLPHHGATVAAGIVARCHTCVYTNTRTEGGTEVRISCTAEDVGDKLRIGLIPNVSDGTVESVLIGSLRTNVDLGDLHTSLTIGVHHEVRRFPQLARISDLPLSSRILESTPW